MIKDQLLKFLKNPLWIIVILLIVINLLLWGLWEASFVIKNATVATTRSVVELKNIKYRLGRIDDVLFDIKIKLFEIEKNTR